MQISVLTATFNRADTYLPQCIESVERQYGDVDYEHIVVDDCSTDGTWEALVELADQKPHLKVHRADSNSGLAHALNLALDQARGDYVLPLDGGDLLLPRSLETHVNFLHQHPAVDLTFGWAVMVDALSQLTMWGGDKYNSTIDRAPYADDHDEFLKLILRGDCIFNSTAVIRRSSAIAVGGWNREVTCPDWEMWTKLLHNGCTHKRNPSYVSCYRIHDDQMTAINAFNGSYNTDGAYIRAHYG